MRDVEMANVEGMTAMPVTAYSKKRAGRCSKLSPYAKPVTIAGMILVVGIVALVITITSGSSTESKSNDEAAEMEGFGMDIGAGQYYSSPEMDKSYEDPDDEFEYDDDDDFLVADELAADSHDAWDNKTWLQLTEEEKNAAQILGWHSDLWDKGEKPDSCDLWWSELTTAEQYAATLLGWDREEWDEDNDDDVQAKEVEEWEDDDDDDASLEEMLEVGDEDDDEYDESEDDVWDYAWRELKDEQRRAATLLGFTEELWDDGAEASACELSWDQMTDEQEEAATLLGWDKESWDETRA